MKRLQLLVAGVSLAAMLALSACAGDVAAQTSSRAASRAAGQAYAVSNDLAPNAQKGGPGNGGNGKQDNKGKTNKGNDEKAKPAKPVKPTVQPANQANAGRADGQPPAGKGIGAWWRDFQARLFGGQVVKQTGWQLGRFKNAFPFAQPVGWQAQERGDALVMNGPWQGGEYLFQLTRSVQVKAQSLQDWVAQDLPRLGVSPASVQYSEVDNVQVAVVKGVSDPEHACPVAYVYLWTANPAGHNQRQAMGMLSQAPDSTCSPQGLSAFVDAYLAQLGDAQNRAVSPAATSAPTVIPMPTATFVATAPGPTSTPSSGGVDWQRSRFFNAFSFAYPQGWTMDRLGDTAHLQGEYGGKSYVADLVWVRDAPQVGLEEWARADLEQLGVNVEGLRIDYLPQGADAQVAVISGVQMQGYDCPVVRLYVVANNAATGGQRSYTATAAQANGQTCDKQALEDLAYAMVQQG